MTAVCAEDVFGSLVDSQGGSRPDQVLDQKFSALYAIVNPSLYNSVPDDKELAVEALVRLNQFSDRAKVKIDAGMYGAARGITPQKSGRHILTTGKRDYYIGEPFAKGSISTVHIGECALGEEFAGRVAIKIVDDVSDNELMRREMRMLNRMNTKGGKQRKHLPILLDHFRTDTNRIGIITRFIDECYDLDAIRQRYSSGVDQKHMVWMLSRLLSAAGYAHSLGIVHGNIEPKHLLVRPRDHNLFMIDWSWSVFDPAHTGDQFLIKTESFSAPEVVRKGNPTPAADIYSIGKCMIYVLGGDVETNEMPETVEEEVHRLLEYLVRPSPLQRPQDAWAMWRFLDETVRKLWGPKKFLEFHM